MRIIVPQRVRYLQVKSKPLDRWCNWVIRKILATQALRHENQYARRQEETVTYNVPIEKRMQRTTLCIFGMRKAQRVGIGSMQSNISVTMLNAEKA
jgi:hypothetical protein